jgi:hypothetical protein
MKGVRWVTSGCLGLSRFLPRRLSQPSRPRTAGGLDLFQDRDDLLFNCSVPFSALRALHCGFPPHDLVLGLGQTKHIAQFRLL